MVYGMDGTPNPIIRLNNTSGPNRLFKASELKRPEALEIVNPNQTNETDLNKFYPYAGMGLKLNPVTTDTLALNEANAMFPNAKGIELGDVAEADRDLADLNLSIIGTSDEAIADYATEHTNRPIVERNFAKYANFLDDAFDANYAQNRVAS